MRHVTCNSLRYYENLITNFSLRESNYLRKKKKALQLKI